MLDRVCAADLDAMKALLDKLVVLKLNGGLGTTMGRRGCRGDPLRRTLDAPPTGAPDGGAAFLVMTTAFAVYCRAKKVDTVRPWVTVLSGQLQRAYVTGVPSLKQSELEAASEDFSNIIGSTANCLLYKGTLSSGVEIAVVSSLISSKNDWSKACESQYRKKISSLSKVGHKNFINLLGYCEEENPFTRAMVFEYAPNGTLFEHLHVREAENLD
ncbi:putative LRR receptor-like serine/threonine-protein kinase MRH1 [Hordeum vulgare]|nr:putative LRR receptor-like serine/threonine-protein kinase MRH1 [Hordeum vulgare]